MSNIQGVSDRFSLDLFLKARELTKQAVIKIKDSVFTGMNESQGNSIIDKILDEMGAEKKWHPNKFRIGQNTTKSFRDTSQEHTFLKENDIFFIDIGPVWHGHEGDYGETFVHGHNKQFEIIAKSSEDVFNHISSLWKEKGLSGIELYDCAEKYANFLGFNLNTRMKGHRIGDFPHHLFYRGGLNETHETPSDQLWILEIHLISQDNKYGAFYEDILKKD